LKSNLEPLPIDTVSTKANLFVAPREVPLEPPRFEHTSEANCSGEGKTL